MKRSFLPSLLALMLTVISVQFASAQTATPTPQNDTDDVVKITTKLVQVDVVVRDKKGNQVPQLGVGDFELLQDGKVQKIVGLTYVPVKTAGSLSTSVEVKKADATAPAPNLPPVRKVPTPTSRLIAFLVDDGACGASVWGIDSAKTAVQRFIKEQMLPDDLVAIYRTRAGSSSFQQYTSDKASLLKAADKIRWYPPQGACASSDGSFNEAAKSNTFRGMTPDGGMETKNIESEEEKRIREYREDSASDNQIVGTLGVFRYAVNGLQRASGRKMMFVLSDGISLRNRRNERQQAPDAMRELTDAANRAGVVVHSLYLRGGNVPGMIESRDEVYAEEDFNITQGISQGRIDSENRNQEGLAVLANATGGELYRGSAIPDKAIARILQNESGYYLLAYEPDDETFKGKKFNKIEVKVRVPELTVSHRAGFIGVADSEAPKRKKKTAESDLYEAMAAPLPAPGLNIDLSAHFVNSAAGGNVVRSVFHLDGSELQFIDEKGGEKKLVLDVVAVTMDEKNDVIDEFNRTHTLKVDPATAQRINRDGLTYSTDIPVKKSGSYNFRLAVRDTASKMIGTAAQTVQIPDLKRADITVSGLTVAGTDKDGKFQTLAPTTAANAITLPDSPGVPAIRQFRPGAIIAYSYSIYNARLNRSAGRPNLAISVNLYKDGKLVTEGTQNTAEIEKQTDWSRINDFAYMRLNPSAEPGDYALQIVVRDLLGGKDAVSTQTIDFEVVK